jgi:hypothetical protein
LWNLRRLRWWLLPSGRLRRELRRPRPAACTATSRWRCGRLIELLRSLWRRFSVRLRRRPRRLPVRRRRNRRSVSPISLFRPDRRRRRYAGRLRSLSLGWWRHRRPWPCACFPRVIFDRHKLRSIFDRRLFPSSRSSGPRTPYIFLVRNQEFGIIRAILKTVWILLLTFRTNFH